MVVKCLELLGASFGTTVNSKGYKMLPSYVRLIQGDGIDIDMLASICGHLALFGWSVDNLAFGSGGGLLQKVNRDTQKCAYKCSWVEVDGQPRNVFKDPVSDKGKKSKQGRVMLVKDGAHSFKTLQGADVDPAQDVMETVFENGELLVDQKYADIRVRADVRDDEITDLPAFTTSEAWVKTIDEWAAKYEVPNWEPKAGLFTAKGGTVAADLRALEETVSATMTKVELAEALQALNRMNAKLLGVAEQFKKSA